LGRIGGKDAVARPFRGRRIAQIVAMPATIPPQLMNVTVNPDVIYVLRTSTSEHIADR
jgi:hypothetical protein